MSDIEWIKNSLVELKDGQEKMDGKIENIRESQGSILNDTQRNWDSYKNLYKNLEEHKIAKCPTMICHEDNDHKGLFGKILGYIIGILTIAGMLIAATIYIISHSNK